MAEFGIDLRTTLSSFSSLAKAWHAWVEWGRDRAGVWGYGVIDVIFKPNWNHIYRDWLGNPRGDILAGLVVALALIPEAIAFSIIAGVDPSVGLYASFCMAVVLAVVGGRPGMISAATGAMALLMVTLVKEHGLHYLLAATLLTGVLQIAAGLFRLGNLLRFVSKSVTTGFVNALAILIFMAQLTEFKDAGWLMYAMVAAGLAVIYLLPRLTTSIPSPLVCIIALTLVSVVFNMDLRTVGDMGKLPSNLPHFLWPDIPWTWETLMILLPYSVPLAVVGLLESLMTASIVDELTDTESDKNRECTGQGIGNLVCGLFGGMASCAMIGQSIINVKSGGRGRLSSLTAGVFLLLMIVLGAEWVRQIPMAALVAVMFMVAIGTFSWSSLRDLVRIPRSSSLVMVSTVVVVVWTHNLALGVMVGILLSSLFFAHHVAHLMRISSTLDVTGKLRTYLVEGQLFFVSSSRFAEAFDFKEVLNKVIIDVTPAHFWDLTAVSALDKVVIKFKRDGTEVELRGLNQASATLLDRHAVYDKPGALDATPGH
ncbi:MAG: SulP family inorganic anion transporter [Candidatus Methylacidiphilales bacterium]